MPPRRWDPPQEFLDQLVGAGAGAVGCAVSLRELAAARPPRSTAAGCATRGPSAAPSCR